MRFLGYLAVVAIALAMHQPVVAQNNADFDGDGTVGFTDFLAFAGQFGAQQGDGRYQAKYDLNGDGAIDFSDFLLFAGSFGNTHIPAANSGQPVVDQNIDLPAGNYIQFRFTVDTDTQQNIVLQGEFSVENGTVQMAVMNDSEFWTWQTGRGGHPDVLYSPGNTSGETFRLPIDDSDTYYIVFSNRGATAVTIEADISLFSYGQSVPPSSGGSEIVEIPDTNLRAVISDSLNEARGAPITRADMATLRVLVVYLAGLTDLTGLEFATNLTRLSLRGTQISNITVLSTLTNLDTLYLSRNQISDSDLSVLSTLTNLTVLALESNQISDITALSTLTNLTVLSLYNNQISDITALAGLTNLTRLFLVNNQISDITALAGLTNLRTLDLQHNQISDITALLGLTNLAVLELYNNPLSATSRNTHIPALQARGVSVSF